MTLPHLTKPAAFSRCAPAFEDVADAAARIAGQAYRTPLLHAGGELAAAARSVVVKAENLQIGGAFKFRGAYNRLAQLDAAQRARGVVAWSSGNHAQAVAAAGRRLGVATTIVMPRDAPQIKIDGTARLGAEIVFYDRYTENREAIARVLAVERGATLVPSYDDMDVIAGQGTVGLEIIEQSQRLLGSAPDVLLVPCGGGGLVAGCALAFERLSPRTRIYCVEPAGFDDTARSLASGRRERVLEGSRSVCDALLAPAPGELTWPINRRLLAGGISVTDEMVMAAVAYAWREMKLVLEPGGAVAIAALLHDLLDCRNRRVAVVASGGNVDAPWYRDALGIISSRRQ